MGNTTSTTSISMTNTTSTTSMSNTASSYTPINSTDLKESSKFYYSPKRTYTNVVKSVNDCGSITIEIGDKIFTLLTGYNMLPPMEHFRSYIGKYVTAQYMYQYESAADILTGNHRDICAVSIIPAAITVEQRRLHSYNNTKDSTEILDCVYVHPIRLWRDQHDYMKLYNKLTFGQETDVTFAEVDIGGLFTSKTIIDMQPTKPFKYEKNIIIEGLIAIHNIDIWLNAGIKRDYFEAVVAGSPKCKFAIPKTMGTIARNKTYSVDVVKMSTGDTWYEIKAITEVIS